MDTDILKLFDAYCAGIVSDDPVQQQAAHRTFWMVEPFLTTEEKQALSMAVFSSTDANGAEAFKALASEIRSNLEQRLI